MSVAIKKIPDVTTADVSLKQGLAHVQLKPGNAVRLEDIAQKVRDNGFNPKDAVVSVKGELLRKDSKLQLRVLGSNDLYDLTPGPQVGAAELEKQAGSIVLVNGTIRASKDKNYPRTIEMKSLQPSS